MISRRIFFGLPLLALPVAAPAADAISPFMQDFEYRHMHLRRVIITVPDGSFDIVAPADIAAKLVRKVGR